MALSRLPYWVNIDAVRVQANAAELHGGIVTRERDVVIGERPENRDFIGHVADMAVPCHEHHFETLRALVDPPSHAQVLWDSCCPEVTLDVQLQGRSLPSTPFAITTSRGRIACEHVRVELGISTFSELAEFVTTMMFYEFMDRGIVESLPWIDTTVLRSVSTPARAKTLGFPEGARLVVDLEVEPDGPPALLALDKRVGAGVYEARLWWPVGEPPMPIASGTPLYNIVAWREADVWRQKCVAMGSIKEVLCEVS